MNLPYVIKIIALPLLLTLSSCNFFKENGIEFSIENQTDFPIENLTFTTSENFTTIKFNNIEPKQRVTGFLSMKKNRSDGSYILDFTRDNGKKETLSFGYYTNGTALDDRVMLEVRNDTITQTFSGTGF